MMVKKVLVSAGIEPWAWRPLHIVQVLVLFRTVRVAQLVKASTKVLSYGVGSTVFTVRGAFRGFKPPGRITTITNVKVDKGEHVAKVGSPVCETFRADNTCGWRHEKTLGSVGTH